MILPGTYANSFAPRDGMPLYPELWRGCVGAWAPCLGPTGLTLRDWSAFRNNGVLTNMSASSAWIAIAGRYALTFDGVDDYCDLGLIIGTRSQFTLSAWLQKTGTTRSYLLARQAAVSLGFGFELYETIAYINFYGTNAATDYAQFNSNLSGLNHWCMVFDGTASTNATRMKVYVNGVQQTLTFAGSVPATISADQSLRLARRDWGLSYSACQASDVMGHARPLNDGEIKTLARRPGIAYELAPRRRPTSYGGFSAAWLRRQQIIGGGLQ